jgi:sugar phosphate isomerase/epimerase
MQTFSRRTFVGYSAAALTGAGLSSAGFAFGGPPPDPLNAIGVQLYTVRSILGTKLSETVHALDEIGYREAEITWASVDAICAELKKTRLKPVSAHLDSALFSAANAAKLTAAIAHCQELGFQYAVYPYVFPNERGGLDSFKTLADTLNRAGEECRKAGMQCCYHNHAFEFEPIGTTAGTTTGMETLLDRTDKALVAWEMDVFWVSVGGHDPVDLLRKHGGRVALLHLKDKAAGTAVQYNESVPATAFKEVGNGVLDIPAILRAASNAGVKHYFVEQDQTPGDPVQSLRQSYEYLRKQKG